MRFSLVIPCYNEAANLPLLLERGKELAVRLDVEVILVDNGSIDNTAEVLENLLPKYPGFRSIRVEKNQGYGFGIVSGLKAAKGEILGWTLVVQTRSAANPDPKSLRLSPTQAQHEPDLQTWPNRMPTRYPISIFS